MKYANLIHSQETRLRNYGGDIQIHAIRKLYEYMGIDYNEVVRITPNEIFDYRGKEYLVLPINYTFWGRYENISNKIIPVFLGLSIVGSSAIDSMRLRKFQPIGCRDQRSLEILRNNGVEAYLNGCMTVTLPRRGKIGVDANKVFIVDVCDELLEHVPENLKQDAEFVTHVYYDRKIDEAESLAVYERYQREARLVITARLHCAVPCLAYGIPVIYAPKIISTRSVWLQNLIPVYDESTFDKIDWNPAAIDIEGLKEKILHNAADKVREAYDKAKQHYEISEFYEDFTYEKGTPDDLYIAMAYMKEHWNELDEIEYIVWGMTQTAETLIEYIQKNYRNAKLVGIIDAYKRVLFQGIESEGTELLKRKKDAVVFVAAESANAMALDIFREMAIDKYVLCWTNPNYKLKRG